MLYPAMFNYRGHLLIGFSGENQPEHLMACAHSMRQLYVSLKRYVIIMDFALSITSSLNTIACTYPLKTCIWRRN